MTLDKEFWRLIFMGTVTLAQLAYILPLELLHQGTGWLLRKSGVHEEK